MTLPHDKMWDKSHSKSSVRKIIFSRIVELKLAQQNYYLSKRCASVDHTQWATEGMFAVQILIFY